MCAVPLLGMSNDVKSEKLRSRVCVAAFSGFLACSWNVFAGFLQDFVPGVALGPNLVTAALFGEFCAAPGWTVRELSPGELYDCSFPFVVLIVVVLREIIAPVFASVLVVAVVVALLVAARLLFELVPVIAVVVSV